MNITKFNFHESLPSIERVLARSKFVAFDFEFSGLSYSSYLRNSNLDSVWYIKSKWINNIWLDSISILENQRKY